MKKLMLILIVFVCISCQQDEIILDNTKELELVKTIKSNSSKIDAISQFEGIPVNIMQPSGVNKSRYLGYNLAKVNDPYTWYDGDVVRLYEKDDNSGQQRWILKKLPEKVGSQDVYEIYALISPKNGFNYLRNMHTSTAALHVALLGNPSKELSPSQQYKWIFIGDPNNLDKYELISFTYWWKGAKGMVRFAAGESKSSAGDYQSQQIFGYDDQFEYPVDFDRNNRLIRWEISPAENFTLTNIEYLMGENDLVQQMPDFITTANVSNRTSLEQSMIMSFGNKATESSSHSKTDGSSITVSAGLSVGVPAIFGGKFDVSSTSNSSWTYGTSESKEDSQSYSFTVRVAPYTDVVATASVQRYKLSVTYIAKFKGNITGKIITLSGRWDGVRASTISYTLIEPKSGKILKTLNETPVTTVDLR